MILAVFRLFLSLFLDFLPVLASKLGQFFPQPSPETQSWCRVNRMFTIYPEKKIAPKLHQQKSKTRINKGFFKNALPSKTSIFIHFLRGNIHFLRGDIHFLRGNIHFLRGKKKSMNIL